MAGSFVERAMFAEGPAEAGEKISIFGGGPDAVLVDPQQRLAVSVEVRNERPAESAFASGIDRDAGIDRLKVSPARKRGAVFRDRDAVSGQPLDALFSVDDPHTAESLA